MPELVRLKKSGGVSPRCQDFYSSAYHGGIGSGTTCRRCKRPEFRIRKLPLLRSAPWTILSTRQLQMVGCLGYSYGDGVWAYPFRTQQFAIFALEHALKREETR